MSAVSDILGSFGLTGEIAMSAAVAIADPTSSNINAVVEAYAKNGQIVPSKLMAYLLQINEERYPEDTYREAAMPWLLLGGSFLVYLIFSKKKRGRR
jgi:hypothetical protein